MAGEAMVRFPETVPPGEIPFKALKETLQQANTFLSAALEIIDGITTERNSYKEQIDRLAKFLAEKMQSKFEFGGVVTVTISLVEKLQSDLKARDVEERVL